MLSFAQRDPLPACKWLQLRVQVFLSKADVQMDGNHNNGLQSFIYEMQTAVRAQFANEYGFGIADYQQNASLFGFAESHYYSTT